MSNVVRSRLGKRAKICNEGTLIESGPLKSQILCRIDPMLFLNEILSRIDMSDISTFEVAATNKSIRCHFRCCEQWTDIAKEKGKQRLSSHFRLFTEICFVGNHILEIDDNDIAIWVLSRNFKAHTLIISPLVSAVNTSSLLRFAIHNEWNGSIALTISPQENNYKGMILYGQNINDISMEANDSMAKKLLLNLPKLVIFDLSHCPVLTGRCFDLPVGKYLKLHTLTMTGSTQFAGRYFAHVARVCPSLTFLDTTDITLDYEACAHIAHCTGLLKLNTTNSALNDACVEVLSIGCSQLVNWNLTECVEVTMAACRAISDNCKELTYLHCGKCDAIGEGVRYIAQGCRKLETFVCCGLDDVALVKGFSATLSAISLTLCAALSFENIRDTFVTLPTSLVDLSLHSMEDLTDDGMKLIASHCAQLKMIDITGCAALTDESCACIMHTTNRMEALIMHSCVLMTDVALSSIAERGRHLVQLACANCPDISDDGLLLLRQAGACPVLRLLRVGFAPRHRVTREGVLAFITHATSQHIHVVAFDLVTGQEVDNHNINDYYDSDDSGDDSDDSGDNSDDSGDNSDDSGDNSHDV